MNVADTLREAWKRLGGVEARAADAPVVQRKTMALPSILGPYQYQSATRALPKPTPANLRKFAETPVVRRSINYIKERVSGLDWQIRLKRGCPAADYPDAQVRMQALRFSLEEPNSSDSFRTLLEQMIEDALVGGAGVLEMELTGDANKPVDLWPVDAATIQIDPKWDGLPSSVRYAQATGMAGTGAAIPLRDDQILYLRINPRTHTPFGLGPLEVAFETVNSFLGAHRFAAKLASNSVVQYALWLNEKTPAQQERLIRWWQDEIEGTGRVPLLSCENKPEVLKFANGTDADMRLAWQEFLITMIGNAFALPPMLLGLTNEVNRTTAAELADDAFRGAVVPMARLVAEHITRDVFAKKLGWREFEFIFNELDAPDELTEMQMQTELLKAGVLTVNEVRAMRGLAPLEAPQTLDAMQNLAVKEAEYAAGGR